MEINFKCEIQASEAIWEINKYFEMLVITQRVWCLVIQLRAGTGKYFVNHHRRGGGRISYFVVLQVLADDYGNSDTAARHSGWGRRLGGTMTVREKKREENKQTLRGAPLL